MLRKYDEIKKWTNGTGEQGPRGPQGIPGEEGPPGLDGPPGQDGAAGAAGAAGANGSAGATGSQGPTGLPIFMLEEGPPGEQGPIGLTGATGSTGATGNNGNDGATGSQGPLGPPIFLLGEEGPEGAQGPVGPTGAAGATGSSGNNGADGATGSQGALGPAMMVMGEDGPEGERGPMGPAGSTFTLGTPIATTSGTTADFTVPISAKHIIVSIVNFSSNSTGAMLIQLGDAGGVESSGYLSAAETGTTAGASTAGFIITQANVAAGSYSGQVNLVLENATNNTWTSSSTIARTDTAAVHVGAGRLTLSPGPITTVRLTTVGGNTFDQGEVNVAYL